MSARYVTFTPLASVPFLVKHKMRYPNHGIADYMKANHAHENCRHSNPMPTREAGIGTTARGKYHHAFCVVRPPEQ